MGNHGVLIFGKNVAETFNRLYYFERAAQTYINALQTGKKISKLRKNANLIKYGFYCIVRTIQASVITSCVPVCAFLHRFHYFYQLFKNYQWNFQSGFYFLLVHPYSLF